MRSETTYAFGQVALFHFAATVVLLSGCSADTQDVEGQEAANTSALSQPTVEIEEAYDVDSNFAQLEKAFGAGLCVGKVRPQSSRSDLVYVMWTSNLPRTNQLRAGMDYLLGRVSGESTSPCHAGEYEKRYMIKIFMSSDFTIFGDDTSQFVIGTSRRLEAHEIGKLTRVDVDESTGVYYRARIDERTGVYYRIIATIPPSSVAWIDAKNYSVIFK